jgi:hypothetical protein
MRKRWVAVFEEEVALPGTLRVLYRDWIENKRLLLFVEGSPLDLETWLGSLPKGSLVFLKESQGEWF